MDEAKRRWREASDHAEACRITGNLPENPTVREASHCLEKTEHDPCFDEYLSDLALHREEPI